MDESEERHDHFSTTNREQQEAYYNKFAVIAHHPHICFRMDWKEGDKVEELITIQAETSEEQLIMALMSLSAKLLEHLEERRAREEEE